MRLFATTALFLLAATAAQADECDKAVVQTDINRCVQARYETADKELNAAWRALPQATRNSLLKGERDWIAQRDAGCKSEAADSEGGSIYPTMYFGCMERKTRDRAGWLKSRPR